MDHKLSDVDLEVIKAQLVDTPCKHLESKVLVTLGEDGYTASLTLVWKMNPGFRMRTLRGTPQPTEELACSALYKLFGEKAGG